jgi:transcriptional regulator of acetoin/glycerol metabolism
MIVADGDMLRIDASWLAMPRAAQAATRTGELHDVERRSILDALRRSRWRIYGPRGAAALLGVKPTTLYGKMRRHGIRRDAE